MKAICIILVALCGVRPARAQSVGDWIQFLLLDYQKLHQLKGIVSDMQTGYTIIKDGYEGIKSLSQGNFNLHKLYLDGLLAVSPAVRDHPLIAETIGAEYTLVREYRQASARWHSIGGFTPGELEYIDGWYAVLLDKSLETIGELTMVLTADILQMPDGARMAVVEKAYGELREQLAMLRSFNDRTGLQVLQRKKMETELKTFKQFLWKSSLTATASGGMQAALQQAYETMIVHSGQLIGVSQSIAAFAALWYIGRRIWHSLGNAEPVAVLPLLRPIVIGFAISIFPAVIALINMVMQPTVTGTAALVTESDAALAGLLQKKQEALEQSSEWQMYVGPTGEGDLDKWETMSGQADSGVFSGISNRMRFEFSRAGYNLRNTVKVQLAQVLEMLFESAGVCINTIRIFYLIVLGMLGPLAWAFSVFDGFGHMLHNWLAKYLNVFLWLPVTNIFGALIGQIQQEMVKIDIAQVQTTGQTSFGLTDTPYMIFLIMAIVGYCSVPFVANYIVHAGGRPLMQLGATGWHRIQQSFTKKS